MRNFGIGSVFSTHVLAGTMSGSITIKNSQFLKNGKAVFISNDVAALKFSNCLFDGNIDDGFGSAIYLLQTNNPNIIVQIQSCNFTNNKGKQVRKKNENRKEKDCVNLNDSNLGRSSCCINAISNLQN